MFGYHDICAHNRLAAFWKGSATVEDLQKSRAERYEEIPAPNTFGSGYGIGRYTNCWRSLHAQRSFSRSVSTLARGLLAFLLPWWTGVTIGVVCFGPFKIYASKRAEKRE